MVSKTVSKDLCNERTSNILEKISNVDTKLDKWMNNHAQHIQSNSKKTQEDITEIKKQISFILNKLQDQELLQEEREKNKKKKIDWYKYIMPIVIGAIFKALDLIFG